MKINNKRFLKDNIDEGGDIDFLSTIAVAFILAMAGWIFRKELWLVIRMIQANPFWAAVLFLAIANMIVFRKLIVGSVKKFKKLTSHTNV